MSTDRADRGQILILTGVLLTVLLGLAALLIDGGHGLLMRRQLQNATDAAALAGANVIQATETKTCSPTSGGEPYAAVRAAVLDSLTANVPWHDPDAVAVTCPTDWKNIAVRVRLDAEAPTFFGQIFGASDRVAAAKATARHGRDDGGEYNIILLNDGPGPADPGKGIVDTTSWPQARNGCPSLQLNGGVQLTFEGSLHVNSRCTEAAGGAFATKGGSASLTLIGRAAFRMVGEYRRQSLTINPPPVEHQRRIPDPHHELALLYPEGGALGDLTQRRDARWVINGGTHLLKPGRYVGGIELRSHAVVYLNPGIYVMDGGGFQVGAQASVRAVPWHESGIPTTTAEEWPAACLPTNCGVLIYNTGRSAMGRVAIAAGASVQLRAFNPDTPTDEFESGYGASWERLRHLLFWQAVLDKPTSTYAQPPLELRGGGSVFMSGTIYAPGALIRMSGTSGGDGGGGLELTLQFISWDLEFAGNTSFVFRYSSDTFVLPLEYGLVE